VAIVFLLKECIGAPNSIDKNVLNRFQLKKKQYCGPPEVFYKIFW
jgi:hypothetical protein